MPSWRAAPWSLGLGAARATVADFLPRPDHAGARWRIGGLTLTTLP
jgi:hypothetical protein